ncbi:MAG: hypothetical protein VCD31_15850 [Alphaproteobacteria bacterium]
MRGKNVQEDLNLERVVNDPDYRRKAIQDLNRAEERPGHAHGASDAKVRAR